MVAITTYPTNAADAYQDKWAAMGRRRREFGVHRGYGNEFAISIGTGLQVVLDTGAAVVEGIDGVKDTTTTLDLEPAEAALPRNDLIVASLHKDSEESPYQIELEILKGEPSDAVPLPLPDLRDEATRVDIPIGYVYVGPTASSLVESDIHYRPLYANTITDEVVVQADNKGLLFVNDDHDVVARFATRTDLSDAEDDDLCINTATTGNVVRIYVGGSQKFKVGPNTTDVLNTLAIHSMGAGIAFYDPDGSTIHGRISLRSDLADAQPDDIVFRSTSGDSHWRFYVNSLQKFNVGDTANRSTVPIHAGFGAINEASSYIRIGSETSSRVLVAARNPAASNVNILYRSKGNAGHYFVGESDDNYYGSFDTGGDNAGDTTSLSIRVDGQSRRVQRGAENSGGSGFRMLRVAN